MRKTLVATTIITFLALNAFALRPVKRITFPKNSNKVKVTGYLNGFKDKQVYIIKLREGQTLKLDADKPVSLFITDPKGKDVSDMDASCHSHQVVENTRAGDYKIKAIECAKADAWKGTFKLTVIVETNRKNFQSGITTETIDQVKISQSSENKNSQMQTGVDLTEFNENIEKAKKEFDADSQNIKVKGKLAKAYFERAFALTKDAQYSAALGDFRRGLKLNPKNKEAKDMHDQIVSIYQSMGREAPKEGEEKSPLPFKKP